MRTTSTPRPATATTNPNASRTAAAGTAVPPTAPATEPQDAVGADRVEFVWAAHRTRTTRAIAVGARGGDQTAAALLRRAGLTEVTSRTRHFFCAPTSMGGERLRAMVADAAAMLRTCHYAVTGDEPPTAVLIIGGWSSRCSACGADAWTDETHHDTAPDSAHGGCGARFTATTSEHWSATAATMHQLRPDLPCQDADHPAPQRP